MSYVSLAKAVRKGKTLRCKYPKHGRLNVLKWHEGVITRSGTGPNGKYAVVQSDDGQFRTLRCDKMIGAILS
jgi:hypothetical protein